VAVIVATTALLERLGERVIWSLSETERKRVAAVTGLN